MSDTLVRVLSGSEVRALLGVDDCIAVVERAFALFGAGQCAAPGMLGVHVAGGGFHVKAGCLNLGRGYFAAKVNANFPGNGELHGLPTIQGVVVLCDAENGVPLAVMDSVEITLQRTAAASAVAAKYLARADSRVATICGCGAQAGPQLKAVSRVRALERVFAFDRDAARAARFAESMTSTLGILTTAVPTLRDGAQRSDLIITCTTSRRAILGPEDVKPGTFVAAVGADNPEKQEIEPALLAASTVVVDVLEQAATIGDVHHALIAGALRRDAVHAELGAVVAGTKPGRTSPEQTIVFDSTGMALQDVAAAAAVYERAQREDRGPVLSLRG